MMEPEIYYTIETGGSRYLVDEHTSMRARNAITGRDTLFDYTDIFGCTGTIVVKMIESIYISTPEIRRLSHRHHAAWHIEEKEVRQEYYSERGLLYEE